MSINTNKTKLPPYVYLDNLPEDFENVSYRNIRSSVSFLTQDPSDFAKTHLPFGLTVQPFAEQNCHNYSYNDPVINFLSTGPFRCNKCKTYVNPFFKFQLNGVAICNICKMPNKVPNEYTPFINELSNSPRKNSRPEVCKGLCDFAVPEDYNNKNPSLNIFLMICIEMTPQSIKSGIYSQILSTVSQLLNHMPVPEKTDICICTFNSKINFYNLPNDTSNEMQIIVVSDLDDPFLVLPHEKMFINLKSGKNRLEYLIDKLLTKVDDFEINSEKNSYQNCLGSILLNAAFCFNPHCGRIIAFSTQAPTIGYGIIKQREEMTNLTTEKEKLIYTPKNNEFMKLADIYLKIGISVDLFLFPDDNFLDIPSISTIVTLTGGSLYLFSKYNHQKDNEKLHYELSRNLTRFYGYDVILTVRTSIGIIVEDYYTSRKCTKSNNSIKFPSFNEDQKITIYLKQEEKLIDEEVYIQFAMLYISPYGNRLLRVINLNFYLTDDINITSDQRFYEATNFLSSSLYNNAMKLYPKIYPIHNELFFENSKFGCKLEDKVIMPTNIPNTIEKIDKNGIYIIDTIDKIIFYFCQNFDESQIKKILSIDDIKNLNEDFQFVLNEFSDYSEKVNNIISQLRKNKNGSYQKIAIITDNDFNFDKIMKPIFVEDEYRDNERYSEFLCTLNSWIKDKYSN